MESGFLKTLNEQQEAALNELGEKTKHIPFLKNHPDGDAYLLRFLRATMEDKKGKRIFHVENWGKNQGALSRITQAVDFFEKCKISEEPASWKHFSTKIRPFRLWWDKIASAVVFTMKIGEFLATADENMYSMEEWEKLVAYTFYVVEGECRKFRQEMQLDDRPCIVAIQDISHAGIGIRKKRALFKLHSRVLSSHFPEALKKGYIVNAPWVIEKISHVLKSIVDPHTLEKISIMGKPNKSLLDKFDTDQLPLDYGGKGENVPSVSVEGEDGTEDELEELKKQFDGA